MGTGLEPILGLLRVMKNLIHLADPPLAVLLERISPLPYYALSNLLTLFSHDMPSLPLIQHVFDYLLCRPPIAVVYLATALILCRKPEIEILEAEGEEGMVHSLLSGLPDLYEEDEEEDCDPEPEADGRPPSPEHMAGGDPDEITGYTTEEDTVIASSEPVESTPSETTLVSDAEDTNSPPPDSKLGLLQPTVPSLDQPPPYEPTESECAAKDDDLSPEPPEETSSDDEQPHHRRPRIALTTLLVAADELFTKFPPTHPELSLSSIMGPQSVVFTWSESKSEMPSDDEAERMVEKPELIVRPYVDPDATKAEADSEKRRGHRRGKKSRAMFGHVERRTVVAGAVVMVGVAVAVYGIKTKGGIGKDGTLTDAREWQKAGNWIGGALISVGERLYHVMS
ncbi:hypothetical protein ONZ45_g3860 [Pleurotus djamor]|nr:hypothetical protein ONZ45_g3860 [Pleurotus djamor]